MIDPNLDLQQAIRDRLVGDPNVTALVPATAIFDRSRRPEAYPCIVLGEGQTVRYESTYERDMATLYADVHIWAKAEQEVPNTKTTINKGVSSAKAVTGPVHNALRRGRLVLSEAYCIDHEVNSVRFMRDPGGELAHAVLTIRALVRLPDYAVAA